MMQTFAPSRVSVNDPLLDPYLRASAENESERLLTILIRDHLGVVLKRVIHFRLRGIRPSQDLEDVYSDALVQLLIRLHRLKNDPDSNPIANIRDYGAVIAHNACHEYLRLRRPRRWSLKNHLRYFLTHRRSFALWKAESGHMICGLSVWNEKNRKSSGWGRVKSLSGWLEALDAPRWQDPDLSPDQLAMLLRAIFEKIGDPIDLDDLITVLADWWGLAEPEVHHARLDQEAQKSPAVADESIVGADRHIETCRRLEALWEEVCQIPLRQRIALLLGLRDANGNGIAEIFFMMGIAALRKIAAVLEFSPEELAKLWNDLPLEDNAIASRLGITRQQVINLRMSARKRLARRMTEWQEQENPPPRHPAIGP